MKFGKILATTRFPNEKKMTERFLGLKKSHLLFLRTLPIEKLCELEDLGFLRSIGRDTTVFVTKLPPLEVVFDEYFSYLEGTLSDNSSWIWNSSNHQEAVTNKEVEFNIVYRSYLSRSMQLSLSLKDSSLNEIPFELTSDQTHAVSSKEIGESHFRVRLKPGVNVFKLRFSAQKTVVAPDGRQIEFGIHNLTIKNLPLKSGATKAYTLSQASLEQTLRRKLHSAGYELVIIRSLHKKLETQTLNVEGKPFDYWRLSLKHTLKKRFALVLAKSECR